MRAVSLHRDVILVTSALLQVNCVIVRGGPGESGDGVSGEPSEGAQPDETFVIDSPVLPEELDALPAVIEQAGFPVPSGLLATHGDWDHLLGRLVFPDAALGCAESTAARLAGAPGEAQRELRSFDEELYIERARPLALGSVQALPVPGRCKVGSHELQLHVADGHTPDGMAILVPCARALVVGDYLSAIEIPTLGAGGSVEAYLATLQRLRALVETVEHVVPGHGPMLDRERALRLLDEDGAYVQELRDRGADAQLPAGRRTRSQQRNHARNVAGLAP